ncbi:MAG: hypothetical protein JST36_09705 [Bacteroidetes bacterium]|nr:hypothetical protein [Bacteroidota bacterium]
MKASILIFLITICLNLGACGVYSFSGASIEGKSIHFSTLDNHASNVVPTLSASLTNKIRSRILSQTGLTPLNSGDADYDVSGSITSYVVTVSALQNTQVAAQNRLSITINIDFKNRVNPKANFTQAFTQFSDFPAAQNLQQVQDRLIDDIGTRLADDVFNKAFVNW